MNCAILLAAGSGSRMNGIVEDKILFPIMGMPVISYSFKAFIETKKFDHYLIVYRDEVQKESILKLIDSTSIQEFKPKFIKGGSSRQVSVFNALQEVESWEQSTEYVAIHDAARPLINPEFILQLLKVAKTHQNAVPATLMVDTIKQINENLDNDHQKVEDLERSKLRSVQTPQIYNFNLIYECYQKVFQSKQIITDDSSALAFSDIQIKLVLNDVPNPKLTMKNDLDYILYLLNQNRL